MIKKLFHNIYKHTTHAKLYVLDKNIEALRIENDSFKVILKFGVYRDDSWIVMQLHKQVDCFMEACGLSEIDVWPPLFHRFSATYSFSFSSEKYDEMITETIVANKLYDLFKIAFDMYPVQFYTADYL